jgi:hypothetical protein
MRLFIQLTVALAAIAQVSAEQRSDTILIKATLPALKPCRRTKQVLHASSILTTTVAVATTSPQLGNSILLGRQLNTKGTTTVT